MAFSLQEFSSKINDYGIAKSSFFIVRIFPPRILFGEENLMPDADVTFFCHTINLPDISFETVDFKNQNFGLTEKRPVNMNFSDVSAVFYVDSDMLIKRFFHRWMQVIYNYDLDKMFSQVDDKLTYELEYKDNYVGTMEITVFGSNSDGFKYTYLLKNVYPNNIGSISESWANDSTLMSLPISFAYDSIRLDGAKRGIVSNDLNRGNGILSYISSINTIGQAINQIGRPNSFQDFINETVRVNTILKGLF